MDAVKESHSPEGLFWRLIKLLFCGVRAGLIQLPTTKPSRQSICHTWESFKSRVSEQPGALFLAIGTAGLYIGIILISIYSVLVAGNTIAVSDNHPGCGIFLTNDSTGLLPNPYWSRWRKYYHDLESESGEYARRCYNGTDHGDDCNYFYEPSIQFTVKDNDTCPFESKFGPLCIGGSSGAFTLSTGYVRPETIGINTELNYTFVRQATCSPLLMDDRFVRPVLPVDMDNEGLTFRYFYGNSTGSSACSGGLSNCTCELSAGFHIGSSSSYSVL